MIRDEREYRVTLAAVQRLVEGLEHADEHAAERDPLAQHLLREGVEGQLETLRAELAEYDAVRHGGEPAAGHGPAMD
ncbi:MAG TPA: hypothetical protein VFL91_15195 [Thermomicrobiales bacterium]|nr:hypothetical protein [Thermomicrobiales bacterium]